MLHAPVTDGRTDGRTSDRTPPPPLHRCGSRRKGTGAMRNGTSWLQRVQAPRMIAPLAGFGNSNAANRRTPFPSNQRCPSLTSVHSSTRDRMDDICPTMLIDIG